MDTDPRISDSSATATIAEDPGAGGGTTNISVTRAMRILTSLYALAPSRTQGCSGLSPWLVVLTAALRALNTLSKISEWSRPTNPAEFSGHQAASTIITHEKRDRNRSEPVGQHPIQFKLAQIFYRVFRRSRTADAQVLEVSTEACSAQVNYNNKIKLASMRAFSMYQQHLLLGEFNTFINCLATPYPAIF